jgi:ribonuclease BN (tRNA processing enzyme)
VIGCSGSIPEVHAAAGAGHLVLTHLDPDYDPAPSLTGARDAFAGPVSLAAPGQVLDLT